MKYDKEDKIIRKLEFSIIRRSTILATLEKGLRKAIFKEEIYTDKEDSIMKKLGIYYYMTIYYLSKNYVEIRIQYNKTIYYLCNIGLCE